MHNALRCVDVAWHPLADDPLIVPDFKEGQERIVSVNEFRYQGTAWVRVWIQTYV